MLNIDNRHHISERTGPFPLCMGEECDPQFPSVWVLHTRGNVVNFILLTEWVQFPSVRCFFRTRANLEIIKILTYSGTERYPCFYERYKICNNSCRSTRFDFSMVECFQLLVTLTIQTEYVNYVTKFPVWLYIYVFIFIWTTLGKIPNIPPWRNQTWSLLPEV